MSKTAFIGGLLIDGTGAAAVNNSLVLIDEEKIVYAGPQRKSRKGSKQKISAA